MNRCAVAIACAAVLSLGFASQSRPPADFEKLPFAPRHAICFRTGAPIVMDGKLDDAAWRATPWSETFVDIEGERQPPLPTRMKMLWDDRFFYVAAELEEPHLWATLTQRDAVIFQDNDFELFLDPDGDTHNYYELEVNALGTAWDLLLVQPYRDGGPAIHAWDIAGLQVGVDVQGTINRPDDRDRGWTVEIAMPWEILREAAPNRAMPRPGDQWRVNFSRVQWQLDIKDGRLHEAARCENRQAAARGQLGLEPAGRHQHAHAGAMGLRAILRRDGWRAGGRSSRTATSGSSGHCAACTTGSGSFARSMAAMPEIFSRSTRPAFASRAWTSSRRCRPPIRSTRSGRTASMERWCASVRTARCG